MFELPNPQRCEQERFRPREGADCRHGRSNIAAGWGAVSILAISAAVTVAFVRLIFFDATGRLACRQMTAAVHKVPHSQATSRPLICRERARHGNSALVTFW